MILLSKKFGSMKYNAYYCNVINNSKCSLNG